MSKIKKQTKTTRKNKKKNHIAEKNEAKRKRRFIKEKRGTMKDCQDRNTRKEGREGERGREGGIRKGVGDGRGRERREGQGRGADGD